MLLVYFAGALVLALALFLVRRKRWNYGLLAGYSLWLGGLVTYEAFHLGEVQYTFFMPDSLGILFLAVLAVVGAGAVFHSILYAESRTDDPGVTAVHHSALVLFLTMISGILLANHAGVLWAFLEATTLTGSVLILHHRDQLALEATWKYVFVCSIGIALAFGGILFLSIAAQTVETPSLFFDDLRLMVPAMHPTWLQLCFLLILSGFSVKMSLVPLFNVDIDAKDMSPTPVGGLFSSALMNAGFVAIFRFYDCFATSGILVWMNRVLLITGVLSLFFAAVYLLKVRNFKRLFAYSSVEHAGLVMLALAAGGVGRYAALLHLVLHSLVKSSLFFQLGQVYRVFRSKRVSDVGGYLKLNPMGGTVLVLGFFSITAMPPGGLFFTELLAFRAFFDAGYAWLAVLCFVLLLFIIGALGTHFVRLLFGASQGKPARHAGIRGWESAAQLVFLGVVVGIGLHVPDFLQRLIEQAIQTLP